MFLGCFSYDKKGPSHCWLPETTQGKRDIEKEMDRLNNEIKPTLRTTQEINRVRRLNIRQRPTATIRKPIQKFTAKTSKLGRRKRGNIDQYRYQRLILLPKLVLLAQECAIERLMMLIQDDNFDKAPAYNHHV